MEDKEKARETKCATDDDPCAVVGAAELTALVWRPSESAPAEGYRFVLHRCDRKNGEASQLYRTEDLFALIRLVRTTAFEIAVDGCLSPEMRNDVGLLAHTLERFLGSHERKASDSPDVMITAITDVLDHLKAERANGKLPAQLAPTVALLTQWIKETAAAAASASPRGSEEFGVCPICGDSGQRVDAGRTHWLVCHQHGLRWFLGEDLIESSPAPTLEEEEAARNLLAGYRIVEPLRPIVLSGGQLM